MSETFLSWPSCIMYIFSDTYQTDDSTSAAFTALAESVEGWITAVGSNGASSHQSGDVFAQASGSIDSRLTRM